TLLSSIALAGSMGSRSSYYSKFQAGNGSWGYPIYNGTPKREPDNRRFSSYSQMENWSRH
ncbi:hypothetical protein, partial [Citrobacter youngae]|uniref:hypothetical protein n=1 Tax=Citrobacter youngae TaxID=133448 RepID=UPI0019545CAE